MPGVPHGVLAGHLRLPLRGRFVAGRACRRRTRLPAEPHRVPGLLVPPGVALDPSAPSVSGARPGAAAGVLPMTATSIDLGQDHAIEIAVWDPDLDLNPEYWGIADQLPAKTS